MSTLTTNFSLSKPAVNSATDEDAWGDEHNDNLDTIDTQLKVARDSVTRAVSGNFSITTADRNKTILVDATGSTITGTYDAAATLGAGFVVTVKKTDASANAVILDGNASEKIDGSNTYTLDGQNESVVTDCDGSNHYVKADSLNPSAVSDASTSTKGIIQIGTSDDIKAAASSTLACTPAALMTAQGFTELQASVETAYANNSVNSFAHTLGAVPALVTVEASCQTTDGGWAVGDRIQLATGLGTSNTLGVAVGYSSTTISVIVPTTGIQALNKSTKALFTLDATKWKLVAKAWG